MVTLSQCECKAKVLDNFRVQVWDVFMFRRSQTLTRKMLGFSLCSVLLNGALGCAVSPLARHTATFSSAASSVIDNSTNAYRAAVDLHAEEQVSAGVLKFEQKQPWDPKNDQPLLSQAELQKRIDVLAALRSYATSLADVTSGIDSPALDSAAAASGASLVQLSVNVASSEPNGVIKPLSTQNAAIASTATKALGEYLISKKVKSRVPQVIKSMDPQIQGLCSLLANDVDLIRAQAKTDYGELFTQQRTFIVTEGAQLSALDRRAEIERLPEINRRANASDQMLANLHLAIEQLALTHHALAAAAQGNNPEALKSRIADLQAIGENLGHFYQYQVNR